MVDQNAASRVESVELTSTQTQSQMGTISTTIFAFTATLKDRDNKPVPGVALEWLYDGMQLPIGDWQTNADGEAHLDKFNVHQGQKAEIKVVVRDNPDKSKTLSVTG